MIKCFTWDRIGTHESPLRWRVPAVVLVEWTAERVLLGQVDQFLHVAVSPLELYRAQSWAPS